jgi:hypothetical protein
VQTLETEESSWASVSLEGGSSSANTARTLSASAVPLLICGAEVVIGEDSGPVVPIVVTNSVEVTVSIAV